VSDREGLEEIEAGTSHCGCDEGAIKTKRGNSTGLTLRSAQSAVALVPEGVDVNLSPGDAFAGSGNEAAARAAHAVAMRRAADGASVPEANF